MSMSHKRQSEDASVHERLSKFLTEDPGTIFGTT